MKTDIDKRGSGESKGLWALIFLGVIAIPLMTFGYAYLMKHHWPIDRTGREIFGDMFGGLNAVFSGLAFVGLLGTLILQRRQLQQNSDEIRSHQKEIESQSRAADRQLFVSQLFQLINSWQEIVHNTAFRPHDGRQAFHEMAGHIRVRIKDRRVLETEPLTRDQIREVYEEFFVQEAMVPLGNVFRVLYHIFKFVDEADGLSDKEKYKFARIVRAYLSDSELTLLFFNGLSQHGEKFFPLIEEYDLLQNFSFGGILLGERAYYPETNRRMIKLEQAAQQ